MTESPPTGSGWSRRRRIRGTLIALAVFLLFFQTPCCPRYNSSCGPVSLTTARLLCPISVPASARNIQYKKFSFFQAYEVYVRFEAPVEDCLAHAKAVIQEWDSKRHASTETATLTKPPRHPTMALSVPWFDVENIRQGVAVGSGGIMWPNIWIDTERGVFYLQITD